MKPQPTEMELRLFRRRILRWGRANYRDLPWRRANDPWGLIVAEVLLRQTIAERVEPVYKKVMSRWPRPAEMMNANESVLREEIQSLGLLARAKELIRIATAITSEKGGVTPNDPEWLRKLPGIGRYSLGAICLFGFNRRAAIVDSNIARLFNRLRGFPPRPASLVPDGATIAFADTMLPKSSSVLKTYGYALLDFTARVCTYHHPRCTDCPLQQICCHGRSQT